jgi:hypothetical protein
MCHRTVFARHWPDGAPVREPELPCTARGVIWARSWQPELTTTAGPIASGWCLDIIGKTVAL